MLKDNAHPINLFLANVGQGPIRVKDIFFCGNAKMVDSQPDLPIDHPHLKGMTVGDHTVYSSASTRLIPFVVMSNFSEFTR